ncbi:MAG: hypothetical protein HYZ28_03730 [Myxococcales bacterium]|nr:hypothetical protein [Myxococcales bacterium]
MEALGGYRELAPAARLLGIGVFLFALLLTALLERLQFQLRATEASRWWASNGRDVVNALALAAMTVGLRAIGFAGPVSLAIAATLVIIVSLLQTSLARYPTLATFLSVAVSLLVGVPVVAAPRAVQAVFRGVIEGLFG